MSPTWKARLPVLIGSLLFAGVLIGWNTINATPPMIICGALAAVLLIAWINNARPQYLLGIGCLAVLAAVLFFVEQLVVTEAERMEQKHQELVTAFENNESDKVLSFLSPSLKDKIGGMIENVMADVKVHGKLDLKIDSMEFSEDKTELTSRFHVNGTIQYREYDPAITRRSGTSPGRKSARTGRSSVLPA